MRNIPDRSHADLQTPGWSPPDERVGSPSQAQADGDQSAEWSLLLGPVQHVNQQWMRQVNRSLVLACVWEHGPITRVQLAERTALSRATVSAIISALLQEGVIREGERLPSTARGGRRAVLLYAVTHRAGSPDTPAIELVHAEKRDDGKEV